MSKVKYAINKLVQKKRDSTLEGSTIGWNSNPLFMNGEDHWIKKRGNYLNSMEREGYLKDTQRTTQNTALNVDLFQNIFRHINIF